MSNPFIGQIMPVGFNYAPRGWALCNGQLMSIAQNQALFALLGTTYGGDGISTFGLPDLRGRVAMHYGTGPGLTTRTQGESSGSESVTLISTEMPQHTHTAVVPASTDVGAVSSPNGAYLAASARGAAAVYSASSTANTALAAPTIGTAGGSQAHNNMQPFLVVNYIIATQGIFPSRN